LEWEEIRLNVMEALGNKDEAQGFRWECFERALNSAHLRTYLKRLPDFDDLEAEERAMFYALRFPNVHQALAFLVSLPAATQAISGFEGDDIDEVRRRRSTANRLLTVLKAALNHAFHEGKVSTDDAWRKVKPFREADAAVIHYLTGAECKRLVNATQGRFREERSL
jgi:hypothetical protein